MIFICLLLCFSPFVSADILPCDGTVNRLTMSWSPEVVMRDEVYDMKFHYEGKPLSMEKARVCFRMWPEELIDEEPLYENCEIHGCDEIEVFVREFFPPEIIQSYCPFKISNTKGTIEYKRELEKFIATFDGRFVFKFNVTDIYNGKLYLCGKGDITMLE